VFAGPYRSDDGGQTWVGMDARAASSVRFYVVPGATAPGLIVGDATGRVWHSTDAGQTMTSTWVIDLLPEAVARRVFSDIEDMRALVIAPSDPTIVYTGFAEGACVEGVMSACFRATAGLFRSHDGGHTWEAVTGTPSTVFRFCASPFIRRTARCCWRARAMRLFRSSDGETT
jgi:photosystem II stability/assembly factor-like uncharacterized protein